MAADRSRNDRPEAPPAEGYRLVVLGGGLAGTAAAREATRRGVRVALILPPIDRAEPPQPTPLTEQIRRVLLRTGQALRAEPPDEQNIDVFLGRAVFCQRHTLTVGGQELRFRKALVATGAEPASAEIDGAEPAECLRAETLGQLTEPPRRLAVIGCGPEACAWAQAFRRLGSQVHLVGRHRTILPEEDPLAAGLLQTRLEQDEIRLHLGCQELEIEPTGNLQAVVIRQDGRRGKLLVDRLLLCGPRRPNTRGLGLESAGVACGEHGIVVGDRLQTTNPHIFAAGGACSAGFSDRQAAEATARLAVHNALSFTSLRLSRLVIPRCTYTDPAIAQVGLTLREANARQIEVDTYRTDLSQGDEPIPEHHRQGLIAVHVRRRTGSIVGATVAARAADELIAPLTLLMTRGWPLAALADVIACRPSRFELLTRLARRQRQSRRSAAGTGLIWRWRVWRRRRNKG